MPPIAFLLTSAFARSRALATCEGDLTTIGPKIKAIQLVDLFKNPPKLKKQLIIPILPLEGRIFLFLGFLAIGRECCALRLVQQQQLVRSLLGTLVRTDMADELFGSSFAAPSSKNSLKPAINLNAQNLTCPNPCKAKSRQVTTLNPTRQPSDPSGSSSCATASAGSSCKQAVLEATRKWGSALTNPLQTLTPKPLNP